MRSKPPTGAAICSTSGGGWRRPGELHQRRRGRALPRCPAIGVMRLDLTDEETLALLNLLVETIEADRYPYSPRIRLLQEILAKCGEVGGLPPERTGD